MELDVTRHLVATLAYRFHAAVDGAPEDFARFEPGGDVRPPGVLLEHCVQVLRIARSSFEPELDSGVPAGSSWDHAVVLLHEELALLDAHLVAGSRLHSWTLEQIVQGPLADVLTHIGQLAMMRRLHGHPVPPQSYLRAQVRPGVTGPDQPPPAPRR